MPHSKDTEPHQIDEPRELLIDLLYGELGDDVAAQAEERVRGDAELSEELGALSRVRAMMRELPEEEPPAALTAKLLHAAALHAPAAAGARPTPRSEDEGKGLWAWLKSLFRPIVMFPGLAAATSLVLVAGIAGVFYASGRMSEPATYSDSTSAAPVTSSAPAGNVEQLEKAGEAKPEPQPSEASEQSSEANGRTARGDTDGFGEKGFERPNAKPLTPKQSRKKPKRKANKSFGKLGGGYKDVSDAKNENTASSAGADRPRNRDKAPPRSRPTTGKKDARKSRTRGAPADSLSIGTEPPPELDPVSEAASEDSNDDGDDDLDEGEAFDDEEALEEEDEQKDSEPEKTRGDKSKKASASTRAQLRSLHDEARAASRNGDCSSVRQIANRVRSIDSRYHREELMRDKSLSKCFGKKTRR